MLILLFGETFEMNIRFFESCGQKQKDKLSPFKLKKIQCDSSVLSKHIKFAFALAVATLSIALHFFNDPLRKIFVGTTNNLYS